MADVPPELHKELYAQFGAAYASSESLCYGLGIFYSLMSFKTALEATKPRVEEKLVEVSNLTLGQVSELVEKLVTPALAARIKTAKDMRNYMAHKFWYENAYAIFDVTSVEELIFELIDYRKTFDRLDEEIMELFNARKNEFGITEELIEAFLQKGQSGEVEPPLPSKKPLAKKMLRIVRSYFVFPEPNKRSHIFESEDGEFFQFCDVGLGWSNFTEVGENWKIDQDLQAYLPASIVPRPELKDTWDYEFNLPKNHILWVQKGKKETTYRYGIKKAPKP